MQEICTVIQNYRLTENIHHLIMDAPMLTAHASPGQFVHIQCGEGNFLRRPISICMVQDAQLHIVFAVKGNGTGWLAARDIGDKLDVLGPQGHGYDMACLGDTPVFIGGGIGVPPMLYAMHKAVQAGASGTAVLGFRDKAAVILQQQFQALGDVHICTDDGSYGVHGFVTDVLENLQASAVCACGPKPMLHAVAQLAQQKNIPCQVSLEERMGCGIGACLVCACQLQDQTGNTKYGHVCKDGPVFRAEEVKW